MDITNSRNLLVAWSAVDTLNADLRCWHVTESAITEVTNVVANSTDDQGLAAISIDTATQCWTVSYFGKSDGSETWSTDVNLYSKISKDSGSTWGSETKLSSSVFNVRGLFNCPRRKGPSVETYTVNGVGVMLYISSERPVPLATAHLGI